MSIRKPADHPELVSKQCLVSIPLRKDWAKQATYWVEVYGKRLGNHRGFGKWRYWVVKQWRFKRRNEITGDNEIIHDCAVAPHICMDIPGTIRHLADWVDRQLEKDYRIEGFVLEPDLEAGADSDLTQSEKDEWIDRVRFDIMSKSDRAVPHQGGLVVAKEALGERFRKAQREREKKAKW